jgi:hypothetical protein
VTAAAGPVAAAIGLEDCEEMRSNPERSDAQSYLRAGLSCEKVDRHQEALEAFQRV